jgi:hypothetical protein
LRTKHLPLGLVMESEKASVSKVWS